MTSKDLHAVLVKTVTDSRVYRCFFRSIWGLFCKAKCQRKNTIIRLYAVQEITTLQEGIRYFYTVKIVFTVLSENEPFLLKRAHVKTSVNKILTLGPLVFCIHV